jgi:serine/threonine protein kinase
MDFINKMIKLKKSIVENLSNALDSISREQVVIRKDDPVIGSGNFGEVYKSCVKGASDRQYVAVKKFKLKVGNNLAMQDAKSRFINETEILKKLTEKSDLENTSNLGFPKYRQYFELDGDLYFVQDFIDGENLAIYCNREKLKEDRIVQLLRDILAVLKFVHRQQIIHRDICPENIMFSTSDKFYLLDFGAAGNIDPNRVGTIVSHGVFTPPEQLNGQMTFQSDIYALGATAIASYLGSSHPVKSMPESIEILRNSKMSKDLVSFLENMTQGNFQDRYSSATEALDALEEITGTVVIGSRSSSVGTIASDDNSEIIVDLPKTSKPFSAFKLVLTLPVALIAALSLITVSFALTRILLPTTPTGGTATVPTTPAPTGGTPTVPTPVQTAVTPTEGTAVAVPTTTTPTARTTAAPNPSNPTPNTNSGTGTQTASSPQPITEKPSSEDREPKRPSNTDKPKVGKNGKKCTPFNSNQVPGCM